MCYTCGKELPEYRRSGKERGCSMNKRMNRKRFNIGTYILQPYARSEAHIRDLAECGIDFVVCMGDDRSALDLFEKYGVGAIVSGIVPGWWGGDGENAGKLEETNPPEKYESAARTFADHPAIWGIDMGDEPSALDFPYYGRIIADADRNFENQFAYLNLYPNYASVSQNSSAQTVNQLGTPTYGEHIAQYCRYVPTDYICYDFYMYSINVAKAYENLRVVSNACRATGRDMWIVLQVNSSRPEEWMSEDQLRFQAYSAMAFGAKNIIWACYTAGWWHNQVLDENGEKTEQYGKLRKVNGEIRRIADEYMRFERVSTHFVGFEGHPDMEGVGQETVGALDTGVFFGVKSDAGAPIVVGQMVSRERNGEYALMVCAADDAFGRNPKEYSVVFSANGRTVRAVGGSGEADVKRLPDGRFAVPISSCGGVLIIAK